MTGQDSNEMWKPKAYPLDVAHQLNDVGGFDPFQHRFMVNTDWITITPNDNQPFDVPPWTWLPVDRGWLLAPSVKQAVTATLIFSRLAGTSPSNTGGTGSKSFITFQPDQAGAGGGQTQAVTIYYPMGPQVGFINGSIENQNQIRMPYPAVIHNMLVQVGTNGLSAGNTNFTLRRNGVSTALTVAVPFGQTGEVADRTHSVTVVADDLLCVQVAVDPGAGASIVFTCTLEIDAL